MAKMEDLDAPSRRRLFRLLRELEDRRFKMEVAHVKR